MSKPNIFISDQLAQAKSSLAEMERNFNNAFNHAIDGVLILDANTVVDCNQETIQMLNATSKEEVLLTHPSELSPPLQPDGRSSFEKANEMIALAKQKGFHRFEWIHQKRTGEPLPVEVSLTTISLQGREYLHAYWKDLTLQKSYEQRILNLVQELEEQNKLLFELATTDELTNVANRRSLTTQFETILELSRRNSHLISFFLLDIDFFKSYNDKFGHVAGDQALRTIALTLKNTTRKADFIARYGGEEFAGLLPETSMQGAINLAEKIRRGIESIDSLDQQITVSIGVTTLNIVDNRSEDLKSLMQVSILEADKALYKAKNSGRNQVIHHDTLK